MSYLKLKNKIIVGKTTDEVFELLEDNVRNQLDSKIEKYKDFLLLELLDTESPIERLMILALNDIDAIYKLQYIEKEYNVKIINRMAQANINIDNHKYRVDYLIEVFMQELNKKICFVIECNGHDFHEKTKEQVKKDNIKNRTLLKNGYVIFNFSGSEIFNDNDKCASEIIDGIEAYIKKQRTHDK